MSIATRVTGLSNYLSVKSAIAANNITGKLMAAFLEDRRNEVFLDDYFHFNIGILIGFASVIEEEDQIEVMPRLNRDNIVQAALEVTEYIEEFMPGNMSYRMHTDEERKAWLLIRSIMDLKEPEPMPIQSLPNKNDVIYLKDRKG